MMFALENVWVEGCKSTTISVILFVYLETENPKTFPLLSGHDVQSCVVI
jgi:hypothetical protein